MESAKIGKSFFPLYFRLAEDIRRRIASGDLKPGDLVPSEAQLCGLYGISRMTVRQGLKLLAEEGLIESFRGRGTFVTHPKFNRLILELPDSRHNPLGDTKLRLLGIDVISADIGVASVLKIRTRAKVIRFRKLYLLDNRPIATDNRFIVYRQGQPVVEKEIHYAAFPEFVARHTGLAANRNEVTFSAVLLDRDTALTLATVEGKPGLRIEQLVFGADEQRLGWSVMICDGERYRLQGLTRSFL
jgi:GntR family transcriptional regulator